MKTTLTFDVKLAGARAFSRTLRMGTYDVLANDLLCGDLTALWDCATLAALQNCVTNNASPRAAQAYVQAVRAQLLRPQLA